KGVRYFGPYAHAWAIRETLDTLTRVFPARTCSAGVFKRAGQIGRPCLLGDGTDADVVAFAQDELEAAVQVFHVRGGRVTGQRGWIVDKVEAVTTGELVEQFLLQVYGGVDEETGVGEAGEAG